MSRRRAAEKREVLPDPKFGDTVAHQVHELPDVRGQEVGRREDRLRRARRHPEARPGQDPIKVFHDALDNVKPALEVRSRRVGGATYQVPVEVRPDRAPGAGDPLADHRRRAAAPKTP